MKDRHLTAFYITFSITVPIVKPGNIFAVEIVVDGAVLGDTIVSSFSNSLGNLLISASVSDSNAVRVTLLNPATGLDGPEDADIGTGRFRIDVWQHE